MHQKRLATEHSARCQLSQVSGVAGHHAAPKTHVYAAFAQALLLLGFERGARGRDR
jgi:hypothetical protein